MAKRKWKYRKHPELAQSSVVEELPCACSDEAAAVDFLERQRWGETPTCAHCNSANTYKMTDWKTGERNRRFLWRCHDCKKQYTVRVGTVFEESRIPLRHWCYAFWAACASKKGVAALQITRQCQLSYKSALFMMHRIKFAMMPTVENEPKLSGVIEADEAWLGGKPRYKGNSPPGGATSKQPVVGVVQRGGSARCEVVTTVSAPTVSRFIRKHVDPKGSRLMTDESGAYDKVGREFTGGHDCVRHCDREYVRGDVTTNTVEGFWAIVKRGLVGVYHAVSVKHLPKYLGEFSWRYNARMMTDGARVTAAVLTSVGKRLTYRPLRAGADRPPVADDNGPRPPF